MTSRFRVGDRVRVITTFYSRFLVGDYGVITTINSNSKREVLLHVQPEDPEKWNDYLSPTGYTFGEHNVALENGLDVMLRESFGD